MWLRNRSESSSFSERIASWICSSAGAIGKKPQGREKAGDRRPVLKTPGVGFSQPGIGHRMTLAETVRFTQGILRAQTCANRRALKPADGGSRRGLDAPGDCRLPTHLARTIKKV